MTRPRGRDEAHEAKRAHPDAGGSHEQMAEINAAMRAAKEDLS